jgi:hypothetical protein
MGSAFVAKADDATGVYWNPAGLSFIKNIELNYSYSNFVGDVTLEYFSLVVLLKKWGTLNLNTTFFNMDKMEITTLSQPDGTGEYFDAGSKSIGLSYSYKIIQFLSFGVTFKYIEEKIYHCKAKGYAFDVGIIYIFPIHNLRAGLSLSNYGTKMQMKGRDMLIQPDIDPSNSGNNAPLNAILKTDKFDLPKLIRFGMTFDLLDKIENLNFDIACNGVKHKNEDLFFNLGAEFIYNNLLFLRMGYINFLEQNREKRRLCYGFGLRLNFVNTLALKLDYACQDKEPFTDYIVYSIGLELLLNK